MEAFISETNPAAGREVRSESDSVTVSAEDISKIISNAGSIAISSAKGNEWGVGLALGAAVAVNISDKKIRAGISGANVKADKDVIVTADSNASTWALTMGGFGAGAKGTAKYAFALAAGAAGSVNLMDSVVESYIKDSTIETSSGGVTLSAEDNASIEANSIVVGIAVAIGKTSAVAASLGGSFAVNDLQKETRATVSSSSIVSAQQVDIDATSSGTIWALTIGGVGSGGKAEQNFGGAISVAGAAGVNTITSTVEAFIDQSTVSTTVAGSDISLTADDRSAITANAGILSIAVGLGNKALAASMGGSVAINSVTGAIRAYSKDSTLTSAGGLDLTAASGTTIWAMTPPASARAGRERARSVWPSRVRVPAP